MYSKDELLSKDISELEHIAKDLDAVFNAGDDKEKLAYSILDKQAEEEGSSHPLTGLRRKRTRIAKREDRVYSVKGTDGENFDVMKNQVTGLSLKTNLPFPRNSRKRRRLKLLLFFRNTAGAKARPNLLPLLLPKPLLKKKKLPWKNNIRKLRLRM